MRRQTTRSSARPRHVRVALFTALVLATGVACSWGDDSASGGDATQTNSSDGQGTDTGGEDTDTDDGGTDTSGGGGARPSYVRQARATGETNGGYPIGAIADKVRAQMAEECPGDKLCVEIDVQSGDLTCGYARSDPVYDYQEDNWILVGSTITLFDDCSRHFVPNPDEEGEYIEVFPEATDEPSAPSTSPSAEPLPSTVPPPEPPAGPTPEPSDGAQG